MVEEQQDYITDLEEECENLQEQNRLLVEKVKFMNQKIKVEQTINNMRISLIYLKQAIEYAQGAWEEHDIDRLKTLYNLGSSYFKDLEEMAEIWKQAIEMMSEERED